MQNTINTVAEQWLNSDTGKEVVEEFYRLKQQKGWRFMQGFALELGNHMSNEVLSRKFQKLEDRDKLIKLAAYSMASDLLKFFVDPTTVFKRIQGFKKVNKKQEYGESAADVRRRKQAELAGRSK